MFCKYLFGKYLEFTPALNRRVFAWYNFTLFLSERVFNLTLPNIAGHLSGKTTQSYSYIQDTVEPLPWEHLKTAWPRGYVQKMHTHAS